MRLVRTYPQNPLSTCHLLHAPAHMVFIKRMSSAWLTFQCLWCVCETRRSSCTLQGLDDIHWANDMCSRLFALCLFLWEKSPNAKKTTNMKNKPLSIVFPFWCVFMRFGCVFPLLCVFFGYVFTCSCFFLRFSDVYLCRWHALSASLRFASFCGRNPHPAFVHVICLIFSQSTCHLPFFLKQKKMH